jgi:hypothetical protein
MALFRHARIKRTRRGRFRLDLPDAERAVLRQVLGELRPVLAASADDPRSRRLFPTAYPSDPAADGEYWRLMRDDLVASRLAALTTVETTLGADELSEDELLAWMGSVNSIRLVLGTLLDVSEESDYLDVDPEDPDAQQFVVYGYLSYLLEEIVGALGSG